MSFWTRNLYETDAQLAEDLSHSPSGGRFKMWFVGFGLPLVPIFYGIRCLQDGQATFSGSGGSELELTGASGMAMAIVYIAVGVFVHAHWFWGLQARFQWLSAVLKVLAILVFLGALGFVCYRILVS